MLSGHVYTAPDTARGFDTPEKLTPAAAAAFRARGYQFCVRYVRRVTPHAADLDAGEAATLLGAGLGLMLVQHVESEQSWAPSAAKGARYGETAASEAAAIGVPPGVTIWCDLEGVQPATSAQTVIDYCNSWHESVAARGFLPGLYVGWHAGLDATQLYRALRFTHYWGAYNLDADQAPAHRGLQMRQCVRGAADVVPGIDVQFQVDRVMPDTFGGRPALLAPEGWAVAV